MAVVRKKQDDKNLKILRELVTTGGGNRQCFDCGQKGPTYVNMTIGSFVCTRCSGVLRGLTPPHRVKSISMATFSPEEIEFLKSHGNDVCAKTWLGLWDPKRVIHQDQRELMIDKYERKRYYLEPASPLKSLTTNTTTPKLTSSLSNGSSSSSTSINSTNNNINNNNNSSNNGSITNGSIKSFLDNNNYKNITLASPPSNLRVTANGTLGGGVSGGGGGIFSNGLSSHIQNNRFNFQNQFTPNENGSYNNNSSSSNALMNGFNGIGNSTAAVNNHVANKNSLNALPTAATTIIPTNLDKSHGFTPDSDFVADFGSANIFNATATNPLNGFKLQSQKQNLQNNGISRPLATMKSTMNVIHQQQQQQQQSNGFTVNGNTTMNHTDVINANENFADFDHAPIIYNAAAYQLNNNSNNNNYNLQNSFLTMNPNNNHFHQTVQTPFSSNMFSTNFTNSNNNGINTNTNNFNNNFASSNNNISNIQFQNGVNISATGDHCSSQLCNSNNSFTGIVANNNNNNNSSSNNNNNHYANLNEMQWNLWQQFQSQWPFSCSSSTSATSFASPSNEQNNGWSLPMSNSTSNPISSSATFNSTSSSNSTPPADRYAALKDLDEQLRESKAAAVVDTFSSVQISHSSVNPFKTTQPPTQSQQIVNPFQATFNQTNSIFGTPSPQQQVINVTPNAFNSAAAGAPTAITTGGGGGVGSAFGNGGSGGGCTQPPITGFNNGYITQPTALVTNNLNGCNLHYGTTTTATQQIAAGSSLTNLKNPFTTSSLTSNNPFL